MTARLWEWELDTCGGWIRLRERGDAVPSHEGEITAFSRMWPLHAYLCIAGSPGVMHEAHAKGEALVAAARAGLIDPERVAGSYRINKRLVTFYVGADHVIGRHFATVAGEAGRHVTEAARLYPTSPLAAAWLVSRDEILERGLAREAA
jgi:hypothetical protein